MLLSGNGRHRRPRPTPKFVVAAGVTGAGVALPLLGASGANAASSTTWDAVAQCESGDNWSANTGNGYFGGLQLSQRTWEAYGGAEFAERPDLASRSEQIIVAERVLADQGPGVWPSCSLSAELVEGEVAPDESEDQDEASGQSPQVEESESWYDGSGDGNLEDSGNSEDSWDTEGSRDVEGSDDSDDLGDPQDFSDSYDPGDDFSDPAELTEPSDSGDSDRERAADGEDADADEDADEDADAEADENTTLDDQWITGQDGDLWASGYPPYSTYQAEIPPEPEVEQELTQPDDSEAAAPEGGEDAVDGSSADDDRRTRADDGDRDRQRQEAGSDAPSGAGRDTISAGTGRHRGPSAEEEGAGSEESGAGDTYTVAPGDTLDTIATSQDVEGGWEGLYDLNRDAIGDDPNLIHPGQELSVR